MVSEECGFRSAAAVRRCRELSPLAQQVVPGETEKRQDDDQVEAAVFHALSLPVTGFVCGPYSLKSP